MTNTDKRRDYVRDMYPGPTWKKKVNRMPDGQIYAIHQRDLRKKEKEAAEKKAGIKINPNDGIPL